MFTVILRWLGLTSKPKKVPVVWGGAVEGGKEFDCATERRDYRPKVGEALTRVEAIMDEEDALITGPPALIDVKNACLGCNTILPNMEDRYCAACAIRVEVGEPRDEFGRFMNEPYEILDLGKPITCLMIECKGCNKIDPVEGCIAYEDPSLLLWHKLGLWCPLNSVQPIVLRAMQKRKKVNPLKASKREARALKAAKTA